VVYSGFPDLPRVYLDCSFQIASNSSVVLPEAVLVKARVGIEVLTAVVMKAAISGITCNPILFAICTTTFSELCKNV
jgi:hypothetical protein